MIKLIKTTAFLLPNRKMKRKEFIRYLAAGAGSIVVSYLLPGCARKAEENPKQAVRHESLVNLESTITEDARTRELRQIISRYTYGELDLLENGMEIYFNETDWEMLLYPFYRHTGYPIQGSCTELMNTAFKDIKSLHPEYNLTRVIGNDPDYFNDLTAEHYFILISDKNLMGKEDFIDAISRPLFDHES